MLKIIAGGAIAALMMVAAPGIGAAAETGKAPAAKQATEQATEFSDQRRRRYVRRYYRPYYGYRSYAYRPYYYGNPYGYYGNPYYRRAPGLYFGFGF